MIEITPKTSIRQILRFLKENATKNEITAVCLYVRKNADEDLPVYGTKDQLVCGLQSVDRETLADAMETVFPAGDEEDDCDEREDEEEVEEESEEDADEEDEDENDLDEEE